MNEAYKRILVVGAREHNLKNITVEIPKDTLTVITGPSGSGKSSLALDILYAEGQRRYIESLSSYARQFLGVPKKPDVERIDGLCPSIAIDQKTVGSNPRSTVGTITEMYDYFRVLFARIGKIHCPQCGEAIQTASPEQIAQSIKKQYNEEFITIAAPIAIERKGEFTQELQELFRQGYYRFIIDGKRLTLRSEADIVALNLKKTYKHSIDLLVDALEVIPDEFTRLNEALEKAFLLGSGLCRILVGHKTYLYSSDRICIPCGVSFQELEPRLFSFNSPIGACKHCHGLGITFDLVPQKTSWWGSRSEEPTEARSYEREVACAACQGRRLNKYALSVTLSGKNIFEVCSLPVKDGLKFIKNIEISSHDREIAERLLHEITNRYQFLENVGLGYLSLNRTAKTLSGGEGQRIRLATQIGSALSGVLYVLDEPSIGLHQRDNDRLIKTLHALRDQGNTVLVVEHDHETMMAADYLIDMGPAAGVHGGAVVAAGTPASFIKKPTSLTGYFLSGKRVISRLRPLRIPHKYLTLSHGLANNLQDITVAVPLNMLCAVTGVSGSGKSSFVMQELVPAVKRALMVRGVTLDSDKINGTEEIENLVVIDQSPIGRTCRSNPATYLGIFDTIRALFASLPESNARGYSVGRFSFNVGEGRCKECSGDGVITVSMHFLPDVTTTCARCKGKRFNQQTLEIKYKNKNVADVLAMTAREALEFFAAHRTLSKRLQLLCDVGLDYIALGQPSTTLSGGEAQRIKLVDELAKRDNKTLYVLDEPTTGLHAVDIERLLLVFDKLIEKGNSLLVIEHNLDVIKTADYVIDLGPEGGDAGGTVVAQGSPEVVAQNPRSYTGQYLKKIMAAEKRKK